MELLGQKYSPDYPEKAGATAILWYILHQSQLVVFAPDSAVYFHNPLIPLVRALAVDMG